MAGPHESSREAVKKARELVATTVAKAMEHASKVLDGLSDDEVLAGFRASRKEAPEFTQLIRAMAASQVKAEQAQGPVVQNNLNLVLVPTATSNEAWLERAKKVRELTAQAKVIEGTASSPRDTSESTSTKK